MVPYNSYRYYIKKRFGKPVLKIPINAGFNCPNRDGTKSKTGCHFCDNISFSPAAQNTVSAVEQLSSAIKKAHRFDAFIPYLQPFSNTYGSVDTLREAYEPLLKVPNVIGLAIGTRPDCFTDEIFDYLKELSTRTYLSVELGLQSAHNSTLQLINRHHTFEEFAYVVNRLSGAGIETVAHVMLGLPGETAQMIQDTAIKIAQLPVSGVKIHQLMIIKGTVFQTWYEDGKISVLTLEEYAELLCQFLSRLRHDQHIHRIMADSKEEYGLIAPQWSAQKNESVNYLHERIKRGRVMGDVF